jgi:hypothetical protein
MWDSVGLFVAIPYELLTYAQISVAPESPRHISGWLLLHNCHFDSTINAVDTIIEFVCQKMRYELTDLWHSCRSGRNIIVIQEHLRSVSQIVRLWDTAWVFKVNLHLALFGMSSPMIEVPEQERSAIQSRMTLLDFFDVNFGKLWIIINISFQVRHASTATITFQKAYSLLHSSRSISPCYIVSIFSSALNQWTLCTPIVISQHTSHLGAGI